MKRLVQRWLALVRNHPWQVIAVALVAAALSVFAASRMRFSSDISRLFPPDLPEVKQFKFVSEFFGLTDHFVLIVSRDPATVSPEELKSFSQSLCQALLDVPSPFRPPRLFGVVSQMLNLIPSRGLLLLPQDDFEEFLSRLEPANIEKLVAAERTKLAAGPPMPGAGMRAKDVLHLGGLFGRFAQDVITAATPASNAAGTETWQMSSFPFWEQDNSPQSTEGQQDSQKAPGQPAREALNGAQSMERGEESGHAPQRAEEPSRDRVGQTVSLPEPQSNRLRYNAAEPSRDREGAVAARQDMLPISVSGDGLSVLTFLEGTAHARDTDFSRNALERVQLAEEAARRAHAPLRRGCAIGGLTVHKLGGYVVAVENEDSMRRDMALTITTGALAVTLLLLAFLKSLRTVLVMLVSLAFSIAWTFGLAGLVFEVMNTVTIAFVAILAGLAVDLSIHLCIRYRSERATGAEVSTAELGTFLETGGGVLTATFTTVGAFAALGLSSFPGMRELGLLVAVGMTFALVADYTVLPAVLALVEKKTGSAASGTPPHGVKNHGQDAHATGVPPVKNHGQDTHATGVPPVKNHGQDAHATGVPLQESARRYSVLADITARAARRPKFVLILFLLLTCAGVVGTLQLQFESDLKKLGFQSRETRAAQQELAGSFPGYSEPILLLHAAAGETGLLQESRRAVALLRTPELQSAVRAHWALGEILPDTEVQQERIERLATLDTDAVQRSMMDALDRNGFNTQSFQDYLSWAIGLLQPRVPLRPDEVGMGLTWCVPVDGSRCLLGDGMKEVLMGRGTFVATVQTVNSPLSKADRGLFSSRRSGRQDVNTPLSPLDRGEWHPPSPDDGGAERLPFVSGAGRGTDVSPVKNHGQDAHATFNCATCRNLWIGCSYVWPALRPGDLLGRRAFARRFAKEIEACDLSRRTGRPPTWPYHPEAPPTTMPYSFTTLQDALENALRSEIGKITLAAVAAVVLLVFLHFRHPVYALLALLPVTSGLLMGAGIMHLLGMKLNYLSASFFPMIAGIGVDDGIHLVHRFRHARGAGRSALEVINNMMRDSGAGVVLTSLTTIAGFGSLALASNPALASLGLTVSIGVGTCLVASLFFLPPLLFLCAKSSKAA